MPGVMINAANLRVGGGVQAAASFLDELAKLREESAVTAAHPWLLTRLSVVASPHVAANLSHGVAAQLGMTVLPKGINLRAQLYSKYDVTFTLFGPEYVPFRARKRIVGFADGTSLHPEFLAPANDLRSAAKQQVRRHVSRLLFRRADRVVVEAEHVAADLNQRWGISRRRIAVVPNCYNAVFDNPAAWEAIEIPQESGVSNVCFVTRAYPHKNLRVLGGVGEEMQSRGTPVKFLLTLRDSEWAALPEQVKKYSTNLGELTVKQLPGLYRACDASIFPSLLESFSATPLEAMATGTPLVASDRPFVREVCGAFPWYADPRDAASLADALADVLADPLEARRLAAHYRHPVKPRWDARGRALAYVDLIETHLLEARCVPL